ncbi:MAG: redox-sensing transcriptional repressor Rex [Candidatus Omnitrophica bacterium]|nr:redox-sensing transcriptional repressor Rex [Candidatus Omnitrophota bacterium]
MKKANKILVTRLYRYRDAIYRMKYMGLVKVFSENIADAVGVTSSQVRKDFSLFKLSGNKRGGYVIDDLLKKMNESLGKNRTQDVIIVGCGHIGTALKLYKGFEKKGIRIVAGFDIDESKVTRDAKVPILPFQELSQFIKTKKIKIGILAVPETAAQQVLDQMVQAGIEGILNFAPMRLSHQENVVVNNVNLGLELETIIYFVGEIEKKQYEEK